MEQIAYSLINPAGNITALVTSPVMLDREKSVARAILDKEPTCEQVGFVSEGKDGSHINLRMAGGEFCGNATISAAILYCERTGTESGDIYVKVYGVSDLIPVTVKKCGDYYECEIKMPNPLSMKEELFQFENHNYRYPVVDFAGISHVIIEDNMPIYMAETAIKIWCDRLKVKGIGFMLYEKEHGSLRPLVYVKEPETMCFESSCASGTAALITYLSHGLKEDLEVMVREPGGNITAIARDGAIFLRESVDAAIIDKTI
jgi:diaminopimelate epimerase